MRQGTVRTSVDLPVELHRRLREAPAKQGCSARQLVLQCIEQGVAEPAPAGPERRLKLELPIVRSSGKPIDLTSEELYDLIGFP